MSGRTLYPPFAQTQGLSSSTFKRPPMDGSLTLPELYEWHAEHSPQQRVFVYSKDDGTVQTLYWSETVRAMHVGAQKIRTCMGWRPDMQGHPVVGILSSSDSIPYMITIMSIIRAGYVAFPISPRNSATAVAHLISKANVQHVLASSEQGITDLMQSALETLSQKPSVPLPRVSPMFVFGDLFAALAEVDDVPYVPHGSDTPALIMHSSGSTAFPKPISFPHRRLLGASIVPYFGERDLADKVFSMHVVPMFHSTALAMMSWVASCGIVLSAFEPRSPAPVPNPDTHFLAAKATESDIIFSVPSIIEAWSRRPECVEWLASRDGAIFGGGALNKQVGDYLTSQGVSLFVLYGTTESQLITPIIPAEVGYDWDYFRIAPFLDVKLEPFGDNTYELIVLANGFCSLGIINTKVDGRDAYNTSDLLVEHPTKPGLWKVYGRSDDQIMHNTGEKSMLNQDPHVQSCVMFGRGHFQAGVIVDPKPEFMFDPSDQDKLAEYRNLIWPTVEKMNAFAPQHSRLFKEMIIVAHPSKPFTYTAKGTARRQAVINDHEEEIENLYRVVEETTQSSIPPPEQWDFKTVTDFVRAVVGKVLVRPVKDDDDLFEHGCDSLQATWIKNSLLRAIKDSAHLDTRGIRNFVYDHPSVSRLAVYISNLVAGQKLTCPQTYTSGGDVILVTGTTGSLGCALLVRLAADSGVSKVYALNRTAKNGESLLIDVDLDEGKVVLLEGDLIAPRFGIERSIYNEMRDSVTHIIHNAWRVDFNLALASFENNVKGLRSLIDFALSSPFTDPPRLIFVSSIGVFSNIPNGEVHTETRIAPEVALGTGYGESKWVSEDVLHHASERTPLTTVIVRVGQISGGVDGAWNATEWFPVLVQSAEKVRCFPDDHRAVDWIQLDVVAAAVSDFRRCPIRASDLRQAGHTDADANSPTGLRGQALRTLPALRLLSWFESLRNATGALAMGFPALESKHAVATSSTLADPELRQLDEEM
ncbi:uncharacterized protein B0H18DRAFT_1093226 [Fomitopsis serialis]|uniref:uncharacterized protein n=1 Tax=Fomitopsis serialis TaxID=139415 RepID=UPI002008CCA6|nr:uncharacterized protein B0H18DRAFT_1093226 [Neoantrodia serialis]KAH9931804.1 hypothetical protein B0H18DRAFT_1093226 [Neoantrodia serialis]